MADEPTQEELAALAGYTVAYFNVTPEMKKLLQEAMDGQYEPARLQSMIRNTAWYKSTSQTQREAWLLTSSDPAEYRRRLAETRSQMGSLAVELGVPLAGKDADALAREALGSGWDQLRMRQEMARFGDVGQAVLKNQELGGTVGQAQDRIQQALAAYGVKVSNGTLRHWLSGVAYGTLTEQHAMGEIQRLAKSTWPGLAEQIDAGLTVKDVASPYIESMAEILELNPTDITVRDNMVRRALSFKGEDGKWTTQSVGDFEASLRSDPRWMATQNAQDSHMSTGREVLSLMGVLK
ncbi:hypothetical protein [Jiangella anatolica]|uniref:Uncharacterized protein n=1 Tax=Jiangella anatolica TaxID=2670374 RepID=A0A2W2CVB6_9ACTN|nr:hypothetical protein [Jiangella anatolica]PZF84163.1 hypothetical protein C1I92_09950 [Jiangella anatolica]